MIYSWKQRKDIMVYHHMYGVIKGLRTVLLHSTLHHRGLDRGIALLLEVPFITNGLSGYGKTCIDAVLNFSTGYFITLIF